MVSKNQIKQITSLQHKKYRKQLGLFIAEGKKVIDELLDSAFELQHIFTMDETLFSDINTHKISIITEDELKKISALSTPAVCLAVFKIPEVQQLSKKKELIVALDNIRDPGNLGTIIRLCDWFGIKTLFCSQETADVFNPKTIQATMGSISRVNVVYGDLPEFLKNAGVPVYGTFMDGENLYKATLPTEGIIVMGNEANGISPLTAKYITHRIAIPRFGALQQTESLNVASAASIVLSEFLRST